MILRHDPLMSSSCAALWSCPWPSLLPVGTTRLQKATQRVKRRGSWRLRSVTCDVLCTDACLPRWWRPPSVAVTFLEAGRVKPGSQILSETGEALPVRHCSAVTLKPLRVNYCRCCLVSTIQNTLRTFVCFSVIVCLCLLVSLLL